MQVTKYFHVTFIFCSARQEAEGGAFPVVFAKEVLWICSPPFWLAEPTNFDRLPQISWQRSYSIRQQFAEGLGVKFEFETQWFHKGS
jgi:hypothetical protein